MSYTVKNLSETPDSAVKFGLSGARRGALPARRARRRVDGPLLPSCSSPASARPFGHRHEEAEEVYVVLVGQRARSPRRRDRRRRAAGRDPRGAEVTRALEAGDDGLEWIVFGARHDKDGELDHEFWKD